VRERIKWCCECQSFHTSHVKHPGRQTKILTFEEYVVACVSDSTDRAKEDFDRHPQEFHILKAIWYTTWLDGKGEHEAADQERLELRAILGERPHRKTRKVVT